MGCASSKAPTEDVVTVEVEDEKTTYTSSVENKRGAITANFVNQHIDVSFETRFDASRSKELGKGNYGVVRTVSRKGTNDVFALKTISVGMMTPDDVEALQREVDILRNLDHPSIVRLFETFLDRKESQLHVVMELLGGGDLRTRLMKRGTYYPEEDVARYMRAAHSAIFYCHSHGVCHRDVKLENFVFERPGDDSELKLIDFGLSAVVRKGDETMGEQVGTVPFMAPEMLGGGGAARYNSACDMWALGVASYELLAGFLKRPYSTGPCTRSYAKQLKVIKAAGGVFTLPAREPPLSEPAADLLRRQLALQPAQRISAAAALEHPWLEGAQLPQRKSSVCRGEAAAEAFAAFAEMSPLRRLAFDAMAFSISPASLEALRRTFKELDTDGSGTLSRAEVQRLLGDSPGGDPALATRAFDALDLTSADEVSYTEFLAAMIAGQERFKDDAHIRAAFDELDQDGSGAISRDELECVLGELSADVLGPNTDINGDGMIDFDEFRRLVQRPQLGGIAPAGRRASPQRRKAQPTGPRQPAGAGAFRRARGSDGQLCLRRPRSSQPAHIPLQRQAASGCTRRRRQGEGRWLARCGGGKRGCMSVGGVLTAESET